MTATTTTARKSSATKATGAKDVATKASASKAMADAKAEEVKPLAPVAELLATFRTAIDGGNTAKLEEDAARSLAEEAAIRKLNNEVIAARMAYRIASHPDVFTERTRKGAITHNKKVAAGEATDVWPETFSFGAGAKAIGWALNTARPHIAAGAALAKKRGVDVMADTEPTEAERKIVSDAKMPERTRKAVDEAKRKADAPKGRNSEGSEDGESDALTFAEVAAKLSGALNTLKVYGASAELSEDEVATLTGLLDDYSQVLALADIAV